MSYELANEHWLDGKKKGLLGQFASSRGYGELIEVARGHEYPALAELFGTGASDRVDEVRTELRLLIRAGHREDVTDTARALLKLTGGQTLLIITSGAS